MIEYWQNIVFKDPQWFWLFLSIPLLVGWYIWKWHHQQAAVKLSSLKGFQSARGLIPKLRPVLPVLKLLALSALITAMARPRTVDVTSETKNTQGVDIMMSIDVSASMLAKDLKPNRLTALKNVATDFIKERPTDRIGLVVYAGESYAKIPLTSDHALTISSLNDIAYTENLEGGTAIGMGLATAVNRLKESEAKSKVIILLTDGVNNSGFIDPTTAVDLAQKNDIKVYTIGIGTNGTALSPYAKTRNGFRYRRMKVEIDQDLMKMIAKKTDGRYFRATDAKKLKNIYEEINKLEKSEIEESKYYNYHEKFRPLLFLAGALWLLEIILSFTVFRIA